MKKLSSITKSILWIIFIGAIFFLSTVAYSHLRRMYASRDDKWKQSTTPLPHDVVKELCATLDSTEDEICTKGNKNVYAPDFFPIIVNVFNKKETTYDDVQIKLGKYQVDLEPLSKRSDGSDYFVSYYDLRGDGVTSIDFFFYGNYQNNRLMRIIFIYGDETGF